MSTPSTLAPELPAESQAVAPAAQPANRPLYWSVRRELWENRSLYLAPMAVAAVLLAGFLISTVTLPQRMRALSALPPAQQRMAVARQYDFAAGLIAVSALLAAAFYCLEALHAERRDRSILFWKSLPVSDLTTVLAKACIPLVVLPPLVFAIITATQLIMLLVSTAVLLPSGRGLALLWTHATPVQSSLALLYALAVMALWYAPVYAWLLLVSGRARRATLLWAVLPPLAISIFEQITFRTAVFASLLRDRLVGWFDLAFLPRHAGVPRHPLSALTLGTFLSARGLWLGLAAAAMMLAAAVKQRRSRDPI